MFRTLSPRAAALAVLLAWPGITRAADWTLDCDEGTARCTSQAKLLAPNGRPAATVGLQLARDGTGAILFVTTPLGVAVRPGLRVRSEGRDIALSFDVCYPDGCRATTDLAAPDLAAVLKMTDADLLIFPFIDEKPIALSVSLEGLAASFGDRVKLP